MGAPAKSQVKEKPKISWTLMQFDVCLGYNFDKFIFIHLLLYK